MGRLPGQVALALLLLASSAAARGAGFDHGVVSNGFATATFDAVNGALDGLYPHPYVAWSASETTPQLAVAGYFGVRAEGTSSWLLGQPIGQAGYVAQGTLFRVAQPVGGTELVAESYLFAPQAFTGAATVLALHLSNGGATAVASGAAFAYLDFQVGGGATQAAGETAQYLPSADAFQLQGAAATLLFQSLGTSAHHALSPTDLLATVTAGKDLPDGAGGPVTADGATVGFQWSVPTLAPGEDAWVGVAILPATGDATGTLAAFQAFVAGRSVRALVQAEEDADRVYLASAKLPSGLLPAEARVAKEQLSILRMAQVREPNAGGATPYGAMMAALPPGQWHLDWVRDSAYAAVALARSGLIEAAEDDLTFVLTARVGGYETEVGHPYAISICRHYGDGEEWSDLNQDGPNIELDGFGLTLWAAAEVVRAGGEAAWLESVRSRLLDGTAALLPQLVDSTGLVTPDSSIWEVHWDGQQRHFLYTDAAAVAGLCGAADLATRLGDPRGPSWALAARGIESAIQAKGVDQEGALAGTMEGAMGAGDDRDAAALEAINFGAIPATSALADQTVRSIETELAVASGLGFRRDNQGSSYDDSEWAFIDLRLAAALFGMPQPGTAFAVPPVSAEPLLDRVTQAADGAFGLIPELYDPNTGAYAGSIPMVGFGAGAYLLALWARADGPIPSSCAAPEGGTGDGGATVAPKRRGCCATADGPTALWALALALGLAFRPRAIRRRWR